MQSAENEVTDIRALLNRLGVASPRAEWAASNIYLSAKCTRGLSFQGLQAAAVYATCRLLGIPRTLREVASASGVKVGEVARNYRMIVSQEDLKMPIQDPAAYLPGIADRAAVDGDTRRRALEILSAMREAHVGAGKAPSVVAAAALCQAYSELHPMRPELREEGQPTQKSVADAAGVSEVSVRNHLNVIRNMLNHG